MQKFIVSKIDSIPATIAIKGQDAKHIYKVLRLKPGNPIWITDGDGTDYKALIACVAPERIDIDISEAYPSTTESPVEIILCSGMLKDKKMDLVIKHVTQLGIHTWMPFFCERSVPTPDKKRIEKRHQRWEIIAKESLKQCRRSRLPRIVKPINFDVLLQRPDANDLKITFWEKATRKLDTLRQAPPATRVFILIGPEGGFSETEMDMAKEKGFSPYSLGPRILRAETAAISSCTLIQHIFGDI